MVPAGMRNSHDYANGFGWSREPFSGVRIAAKKCEGCCRSKAHTLAGSRALAWGPTRGRTPYARADRPRSAQIAIQLCGPATILGALASCASRLSSRRMSRSIAGMMTWRSSTARSILPSVSARRSARRDASSSCTAATSSRRVNDASARNSVCNGQPPGSSCHLAAFAGARHQPTREIPEKLKATGEARRRRPWRAAGERLAKAAKPKG